MIYTFVYGYIFIISIVKKKTLTEFVIEKEIKDSDLEIPDYNLQPFLEQDSTIWSRQISAVSKCKVFGKSKYKCQSYLCFFIMTSWIFWNLTFLWLTLSHWQSCQKGVSKYQCLSPSRFKSH